MAVNPLARFKSAWTPPTGVSLNYVPQQQQIGSTLNAQNLAAAAIPDAPILPPVVAPPVVASPRPVVPPGTFNPNDPTHPGNVSSGGGGRGQGHSNFQRVTGHVNPQTGLLDRMNAAVIQQKLEGAMAPVTDMGSGGRGAGHSGFARVTAPPALAPAASKMNAAAIQQRLQEAAAPVVAAPRGVNLNYVSPSGGLVFGGAANAQAAGAGRPLPFTNKPVVRPVSPLVVAKKPVVAAKKPVATKKPAFFSVGSRGGSR